MKIATSLLLAASLIAHAEVKVELGEMMEKRGSGNLSGSLDVELKVSGAEVDECKGLAFTLIEAKDDLGTIMKLQGSRIGGGGFVVPRYLMLGFTEKRKRDEELVMVELEIPARSAKSLTLDGVVEVLLPSKDPASVVSVDLAKDAGKFIDQPDLKAAGVEISFDFTKSGSGSYAYRDPNRKLAAVEFYTADRKLLRDVEKGTLGSNTNIVFCAFKEMPRSAKVYLVTDKSVVRVPVKLTGVPLP